MSQHLPPPPFEKKIVSFEKLEEFVRKLPHPVVLTNGVFDILHRGHVTYLAQAASLGASLVVAVNSDESVRMLGKGPDRPINSENDRAAVLAALESTASKGLAVRQLKRYASWVQNVVRQFAFAQTNLHRNILSGSIPEKQ